MAASDSAPRLMQEKSTALRADLSVDDSSVAAKASEVDRDDVGRDVGRGQEECLGQ